MLCFHKHFEPVKITVKFSKHDEEVTLSHLLFEPSKFQYQFALKQCVFLQWWNFALTSRGFAPLSFDKILFYTQFSVFLHC